MQRLIVKYGPALFMLASMLTLAIVAAADNKFG